MSRSMDTIQGIDAARSEEEKANLVRTELMIEEATLQLLDIRYRATGRKARLEKIRRLKEVVAVHKRCPAELWEQVFELCCDPGVLDTKAEETAKHPLFTLMQVCSLWRNVVLNSPKLWKNVRAYNDERGIALATRWLSRAGSVPRCLALISSGGSFVAFQQLIAQCPFQSLDITFSSSESTENVEVIDFSQIPVESLLPLERLIFYHNDADNRNLLVSLSITSHSLPNLRYLYVDRGIEMPQFHVPNPFTTWPYLGELYLLCPLPMKDCLSILRDTQGIERCSMHVAETPNQFNWAVKPLILRKLISLTLNFDHRSDVGNFVNLLTLPKLNSLTLCGQCRFNFHHPNSCTQSTIEQLVKRSRTQNLEELRIRIPIDGLRIGRMLQLFPCLRNLIVSCNSVLDWDTAQSIATGELGPRLKEFGIHETIEPFEVNQLLYMLELREETCWEQDDVSRIKDVSFWVRYRVPGREEIERRIASLKRTGIDVTVKWIR